MFDSIIKHCNHLNDIYINSHFNASDETIDKFFAKFAKQLKSISFKLKWNDVLNTCIKQNLKLCVNLVEINYSWHKSDDRISINLVKFGRAVGYGWPPVHHLIPGVFC